LLEASFPIRDDIRHARQTQLSGETPTVPYQLQNDHQTCANFTLQALRTLLASLAHLFGFFTPLDRRK
jgi:hypothetical protein